MELKNKQPYLTLLNAARQQYDAGDYQEVVVLAQTAIELFTEQVFDYLFAKKDIQYLQKPVERLLYRNFNLAHGKVAGLYEALSGDKIYNEPIWSQYKEHTELRNDIVHQGREINAAQATHSLKVVEDLICHIGNATGLKACLPAKSTPR
jgi:hypothetical protein